VIGALAALASSFTWSAGSVVYARLSREYAPSQVSFTRALVALPLFLFAAFVIEGADLQQSWTQLASGNALWLLMSMIASYGLGDVAFLWSTRSLGIPGALAIASSYPFWSAFAGYAFQSEALSPIKVVGIVGTVTGTILVVLVGYHHRQKNAKHWLDRFEVGLGLGFLTSLFWALNTFSVARGGQGLSPNVANAVRMLVALGLCPIIGYFILGKWRGGISWKRFKPLGWVFVLEAYGGSFFFMYGLSHAPLAVASALSSLAPVISVPAAWAGKHEPVSWLKALGVCIAVAGAVLLVQ
jgi:drug/metabolite transporter (DMT)-like permease